MLCWQGDTNNTAGMKLAFQDDSKAEPEASAGPSSRGAADSFTFASALDPIATDAGPSGLESVQQKAGDIADTIAAK